MRIRCAGLVLTDDHLPIIALLVIYPGMDRLSRRRGYIAMNRCSACITGFLILVGVSGCSTFDCCHWWGRNTDGSSNLGKKPAPIQQGPIAGTYSNPGLSNTAAPVQPMIQPTAAPVVTTSPAQTYSPANEANSPAITPPSPPSPLQNAPGIPASNLPLENRSSSTVSGSFPTDPLPTTIITELPENRPSIPSPVPPTPQVAGPTIPGQTTRVENSPMPLLLAPQASAPPPGSTLNGQPTIAMPEIVVPTISKPMDVAMPKVANSGKGAGLNPGTTPPPLPPPPAIPMLNGK